MPSVMVSLASSLIRHSAHNTSPQASRNAKVMVATRPGSTLGNTTKRKACRRVAPSIIAA